MLLDNEGKKNIWSYLIIVFEKRFFFKKKKKEKKKKKKRKYIWLLENCSMFYVFKNLKYGIFK